MYELIQVGPRSYYINAPVKIGLSLLQDNQVCLIDSGNDKDAGRKIRQLLEATRVAAANDSQYTFQRRSHWGKSIHAKTEPDAIFTPLA